MKAIQGIVMTVLWALLHGKPIQAQECPVNAAQPKAVTVPYEAGAVIFKPSAEGILRALDSRSGAELWAYAPPDLDSTHRADGLMSEIQVARFRDAAGEKVWVYFGLRRGGRHYYALDATERLRPRLMWKAGPDELPGIGETWSTPGLARVRVGGETQNGGRLVVIVGGGYDEVLPSAHRIYMVDALDGHLLWYAGGPGGVEFPAPPDLALAPMTSPIPARVVAVDTDGDLFADRLYTADLGGRVWRFDVWNGRDRTQLATGKVFALLGGVGADARVFFNAPDVALIQKRGAAPYYNLAIGSGNRLAPFDTTVHDRFYSLRDRGAAAGPLLDADLIDITNSPDSSTGPPAAPGWKLDLRLNHGWAGEKVLAEAVTVKGVILFPTYRPVAAAACSGENRVYALEVDHGAPALDLNDDQQITAADVSTLLTQSGIAGQVELTVPAQGNATPPNPGDPATAESALRCKVGGETLRVCVSTEMLLRTFWRRDSTN